MRIAVIQGTRPEIIKNYSIVKALVNFAINFEVLHTNQQGSSNMCTDIYRDMGYSPGRTLPGQYRLGLAIDWLQKVFKRDKITHVIVNGDTAASIAGALAAMYMDIEVTHIEAGLRSHDPQMIEERNRIMVDSIANSLFAYTAYEQEVLQKSPDIRGRIYLEGNTTVDLLHDFSNRFEQRLINGRYVYVTLHRKEFTDSKARMQMVFKVLRAIAEEVCPVIFPIHPRTRDAIKRHGLDDSTLRGVQVTEPVPIFNSLALQKHAAVVITDSGCIQEEAYLLNVPCVTIRDNTERHLTVRNGANVVTGFTPTVIRAAIESALHLPAKTWPEIYGMPSAGSRIVNRIAEHAWDDKPEVELPLVKLLPNQTLA
ncbi:MAG: UDP-N-acetylglucosamine 2-epimerase (non-hydrolyzing) [Methylococcales bacterium]|nr:UDP-N-acetylglucosamine 2-epimerase (non-hydrolyzing) [Methylococcales bacterium]